LNPGGNLPQQDDLILKGFGLFIVTSPMRLAEVGFARHLPLANGKTKADCSSVLM
jgi:hypothetical protein